MPALPLSKYVSIKSVLSAFSDVKTFLAIHGPEKIHKKPTRATRLRNLAKRQRSLSSIKIWRSFYRSIMQVSVFDFRLLDDLRMNLCFCYKY